MLTLKLIGDGFSCDPIISPSTKSLKSHQLAFTINCHDPMTKRDRSNTVLCVATYRLFVEAIWWVLQTNLVNITNSKVTFSLDFTNIINAFPITPFSCRGQQAQPKATIWIVGWCIPTFSNLLNYVLMLTLHKLIGDVFSYDPNNQSKHKLIEIALVSLHGETRPFQVECVSVCVCMWQAVASFRSTNFSNFIWPAQKWFFR